MTVAVLIPFKDITQAKSRLAQVLSEERRRTLARKMLEHVVGVLRGVTEVQDITILSPAPPEDLSGTKWLRDLGRGLNPEIADALTQLTATRALVIHADLPQLTPEDIRAIIETSRHHALVLAPDKAGTGTNALLINPKTQFPLAFGPGSFEAHSRAAAVCNLSLGIVRRPGLSLDIDDPADLTAAGLDQ